MRKLLALLAMAASLSAGPALSAAAVPDVAGIWQGTLKVAPQREIQMVVRIARAKSGGWEGSMLVENANPIPVDSVTVGRAAVEVVSNVGRFRGEISEDGTSLLGTWTRGNPRPLENPRALELRRATAKNAWSLPPDPTPHTIQFVTVDTDAKLEVLDWGGTGRPVVLLTGLGSDAHGFDSFAPKLTARYHVYGVTRRGFGNSSAPLSGYSADRLGDDVLAVLDALKLDKPILIGHSIAGQELSSIGSRFPQRVAGLVYLDAGYYYAYFGSVVRNMSVNVDMDELQRKLDELKLTSTPAGAKAVIQEMLSTQIPRFTETLQTWQRDNPAPPAPAAVASPAAASPAARAPAPLQQPPSTSQEVLSGMRRFTTIPVPILAIFAAPHELPPGTGSDPAAIAAADALDDVRTGARAQADALEKGVPSARVVRLPHASHMVYQSNEADVLREIDAFIGGLPQ